MEIGIGMTLKAVKEGVFGAVRFLRILSEAEVAHFGWENLHIAEDIKKLIAPHCGTCCS